MGRQLTSPVLRQSDLAVPISKGGTGAITAPQAVSNLNLTPTSVKDQVGGTVGLNAQGKIPGSRFPNGNGYNKVNVDGSLNVVAGTTVQFQITDFDSFRSYSISADVGTVSRTNDIITYTAPASLQTATLTVNGRAISLAIVAGRPAQPKILAPFDNAVGVTTAVTATSSAFNALGPADTHQDSDWQLASDVNFTNILQQSLASTTNKTTWTPATLSNLTVYYLRVRHRGVSGNVSDWSRTSSFTTLNLPAPTVNLDPAMNAQASNGYFGAIGTYTGTVQSWVAKINGTPYAAGIQFSGGNVFWNGALPYSLSGTTLTLEVTNSGGTNSDSCAMNITPAPMPTLETQNWSLPINVPINTFGGVGGRKWIARPAITFASVNSGSLPPGLGITANQGGNQDVIITGTPTQAGTFTFTMSVFRSSDYSADETVTTPTITITITP